MTTLTDIAAELADVKSELRAVNERLATLPPPPEWITFRQLAEARHVKPRTVREWDRRGWLNATGERGARRGDARDPIKAHARIRDKAKARMVYAPKPLKDEV